MRLHPWMLAFLFIGLTQPAFSSEQIVDTTDPGFEESIIPALTMPFGAVSPRLKNFSTSRPLRKGLVFRRCGPNSLKLESRMEIPFWKS